jgi:hypothetical protein
MEPQANTREQAKALQSAQSYQGTDRGQSNTQTVSTGCQDHLYKGSEGARERESESDGARECVHIVRRVLKENNHQMKQSYTHTHTHTHTHTNTRTTVRVFERGIAIVLMRIGCGK